MPQYPSSQHVAKYPSLVRISIQNWDLLRKVLSFLIRKKEVKIYYPGESKSELTNCFDNEGQLYQIIEITSLQAQAFIITDFWCQLRNVKRLYRFSRRIWSSVSIGESGPPGLAVYCITPWRAHWGEWGYPHKSIQMRHCVWKALRKLWSVLQSYITLNYIDTF